MALFDQQQQDEEQQNQIQPYGVCVGSRRVRTVQRVPYVPDMNIGRPLFRARQHHAYPVREQQHVMLQDRIDQDDQHNIRQDNIAYNRRLYNDPQFATVRFSAPPLFLLGRRPGSGSSAAQEAKTRNLPLVSRQKTLRWVVPQSGGFPWGDTRVQSINKKHENVLFRTIPTSSVFAYDPTPLKKTCGPGRVEQTPRWRGAGRQESFATGPGIVGQQGRSPSVCEEKPPSRHRHPGAFPRTVFHPGSLACPCVRNNSHLFT